MAIIQRFSGNIRGVVAVTGNTNAAYFPASPAVGRIYNSDYMNTAGNAVSTIGNSGSFAPLFMPENSKVLYAQLLWSGEGSSSRSAFPITFITPTQTIPNLVRTEDQNAGYGARILDVTTIVRNGGSGFYGCTSIPSSNLGGCWFLSVVYENTNFPLRAVKLLTGAASAGGTYSITGIQTPSAGPCNAAVVIAASQTDYGDSTQAFIGHTVAATIPLGNPTPINQPWNGQAPYSPAFAFLTPNFSNGNLADPNFSLLETRGTGGTYNFEAYSNNMNNGFIANPPVRLLASLGSQNILGYLKNNQNQVYFRTSSAASTDLIYGLMVDLNQAQVNINKTVDKEYTYAGDTLVYTLVISNIGLVPANELVLRDILPVGQGTFVPNSVIINGSPDPGNIETGISLGNNFIPGQLFTITFNSILSNTLTKNTAVKNTAEIDYTFVPGVGLDTVVNLAVSNIATTTIISVSTILSEKSVNPEYGILNEELDYTIVLNAKGENTLSNVKFSDTIPDNTSFVAGSLSINGTPTGNNPTPPGFNLSDFSILEVRTITFKVIVTTIPTTNMVVNQSLTTFQYLDVTSIVNASSLSNVAISTINYSVINATKATNKAYATIGDTISYTISLTNTGNTVTDSIVFLDTIPYGLTFEGGSFSENGVATSKDPNPPGTTIPNINPNEILTITFTVLVTTLPTQTPISNTANISYTNIIDPNTQSKTDKQTNTNEALTDIKSANLNSFIKYVNKQYATCNDTLTYTLEIANLGNTTAKNVLILDTIPNGTIFTENSVSINGISQPGYNPSLAMTVPNIAPGAIATITFKVVIDCN